MQIIKQTMRIRSFLVLLAIASSCESELNFMDVIDVVKLLIDFSGFDGCEVDETIASEP